MKLELRKIYSYLPFDVKAKIMWSPKAHQGVSKIRSEISKLSLKVVESVYDGEGRALLLPSEEKGGLSKEYIPIKFELILRPLSDLTKEIDRIKLEVGLTRWVDMLLVDAYHPSEVEYCAVEWMFKYHFDVFGLIPAGLAIDLNTLTPSTETLKED